MTKGPHGAYSGSSKMGSYRARSASRAARSKRNPKCIQMVPGKGGRMRRCKNPSMNDSLYCYVHDPRPNKGYAPGYGPEY